MLRSDTQQIFISKYRSLIMSVGITAFVVWNIGFRWALLLILVPLFLITCFHLSLAVVEASDEGIRYRRLSDWRRLRFDEITSCDFSKLQWEIGYIGLKRFVWPWGKIYFVLDDPLQKGVSLVSFIRQRMGRNIKQHIAVRRRIS